MPIKIQMEVMNLLLSLSHQDNNRNERHQRENFLEQFLGKQLSLSLSFFFVINFECICLNFWL